MILSLNLNY